MKRTIIQVSCDWPGHGSTEVEGTPVTMKIGESEEVELDLCSDCQHRLVQPLVEMIQDAGQPLESRTKVRTRKKPGPVPVQERTLPCPDPDCEYKGPNRDSLRSHTKSRHNKNLAMYEGADPNINTPYNCEQCAAGFTTPQGLAVHRRMTHERTA